jgi:hypothetical protein
LAVKKQKKQMKRKRRRYRYEETHRTVKGVKQKRCGTCRKWKAEDRFNLNRSSKDGRQHYCRDCMSKNATKHYRPIPKEARINRRYEDCHRVFRGSKQKLCKRCEKWKVEGKFYSTCRHKDGLSGYCKKCSDEATNKARRNLAAVRSIEKQKEREAVRKIKEEMALFSLRCLSLPYAQDVCPQEPKTRGKKAFSQKKLKENNKLYVPGALRGIKIRVHRC